MRRPDYDDDQAADALYEIAAKLKAVDKLFADAWDRFPSPIRQLFDKIDPKNEMDPDYWAKQFEKYADVVAEEAEAKRREVLQAEAEPSRPKSFDVDSPGLSFDHDGPH